MGGSDDDCRVVRSIIGHDEKVLRRSVTEMVSAILPVEYGRFPRKKSPSIRDLDCGCDGRGTRPGLRTRRANARDRG
jgi:hypothetical protein